MTVVPGDVSAAVAQRRLEIWSGRWPVLPDRLLTILRETIDTVLAQVEPERLEEAAATVAGFLHSARAQSLASYCADRLLSDASHPFIQCLDRGGTPDPSLRRLFERDLQQLEGLARLPWGECVGHGADGGFLPKTEPPPAPDPRVARICGTGPDTGPDAGPAAGPDTGLALECEPWSTLAPRGALIQRLCQPHPWAAAVDELTRFWRLYGCGTHQGVAAYRLADVDGTADLVPVHEFSHFPMTWLQFAGPRTDLLRDNTLALLQGTGASNALIWGPRGCGKSTLIRALVGKYWDQGLRAIEIPAASYRHLPALFGLVRDRPERFIAVLDNIGIEPQDPSHRILATMLDGGLEQAPANLVFYATSNYKDLVDRHGERPDGPPPQQADSARSLQMMGATEPAMATYDPQGLQRLDERRALDDRFALKIFIDLPTKSQYEQIVLSYAQRAGLLDSEEELLADFRIWCMRHNHDLIGGRTARDYVRHRMAGHSLTADGARIPDKGPGR